MCSKCSLNIRCVHSKRHYRRMDLPSFSGGISPPPISNFKERMEIAHSIQSPNSPKTGAGRCAGLHVGRAYLSELHCVNSWGGQLDEKWRSQERGVIFCAEEKLAILCVYPLAHHKEVTVTMVVIRLEIFHAPVASDNHCVRANE